MASNVDIYLDFWIDRSESSVVTGVTLTLPIRHATCLITFLDLHVAIRARYFCNHSYLCGSFVRFWWAVERYP